ncbi:AIPR family protein [Bradyrhizobium sp. 18BD]
MSQLTISRITHVLESQFQNLIDLSDVRGGSPEDKQTQFLTRALAALCIKSFASVPPAVASTAVTDGFGDGGLDAICFDQNTDTLLLVQSKWSQNGNKPMDQDGASAFVAGIRDLLQGKFERFNEKIRAKEAEVRAVLYSDRPIKLRLITAHTAVQPTPLHVTRKLDDLITELNDPVPIARVDHFDQSGVYGLITAESQPPKIKLQIPLNDWGQIDRPFLAFYGRVHVAEVAKWWNDHGNALFSQNLRLFKFNSDVNNALQDTLKSDPESFWYFNNGITIVCDTIGKNLAGSPAHKLGLFTCENANIVNGAQTVGTIGNAGVRIPDTTDPDVPQIWVQVRIVSLERGPPEFVRRITRAANLQNAVGNREFAAMDPVQHRLATDFALDRRKYVYKAGEADPKGNEGCSIVEATQALACAQSAALAVQAKREIGALWADTDAAPYTEIFHDNLSSTRVWRLVQVMRAVDEELLKLRTSPSPRADMVAIHMNRVILHLVFQASEIKPLLHDAASESLLIEAGRKLVAPTFKRVASYLEANHQNEYLASLCKNVSKCEKLVVNYNAPVEPTQGRLF